MDYPTLNKILGAGLIVGMSRGRVIVDEQLSAIVPFLREKNIRVQSPFAGQSDESIMENLIGNRIFVTNNSRDFKKHASITETWIISTEHVKSKMLAKDLADLISNTLRDMQLFSRPVIGGMLITLFLDKEPSVEKIEN